MLGVPNAGDADQRLVAIDAPSRLAFTWTLCGVPSRVDLRFVAADYAPFSVGTAPKPPPVPGTRLTARRDVDGTLPFPRPAQLLDDSWWLACGVTC